MSEEPIRVAQIIGKLNAAGVEAVMNNYYRNIDREKYQFDFFIDADSTQEPPEELKALGARYYVIPPYQHLPQYLVTLVRLFRKNRYEIVHSGMNTLSVFPLFAAWLAGVPVRINHNHNTASPGETARNIMKALLKPFAKLFATDYAACSRECGEWLFGKRSVAKGKVTVFNNAIDLSRFSYSETTRREKRKELGVEDKFVVGHVGRFCFQKNQEFVLDVFRCVVEKEATAVLLFVGVGDSMDEMKAKAEALGLADKVMFLGARKDVAELYQAMDAFVFPSRYEGLGLVAIEAQATGLPTICSDVLPEEVRASSAVTFRSLEEDPSTWADEVLAMKGRPRLDTYGEVVSAGFDIKAEAGKLEAYYDEALEKL